MNTSASNLPTGSLVLVTGANGFVASHVVDRLLEDGFNVRGSVRSEEKGKWLHGVFDKKYGKGRLELVVVPDMQATGAFDAAVKGVAGICHTASIMTFVDKPEQVIPTVVRVQPSSNNWSCDTDISKGRRSHKCHACCSPGAERQVVCVHVQQHRGTVASAEQAHQSHQAHLGMTTLSTPRRVQSRISGR